MTKYLGEEGIDHTLPPNVLAGISRGNPLEIHGGKIHSPWAQLLAMGVKKTLFLHTKNRQARTQMKDLHFQRAIWKAFFASSTIGTWDRIMSPFMIRNEPIFPFMNKIGFSLWPIGFKIFQSYFHILSFQTFTKHSRFQIQSLFQCQS